MEPPKKSHQKDTCFSKPCSCEQHHSLLTGSKHIFLQHQAHLALKQGRGGRVLCTLYVLCTHYLRTAWKITSEVLQSASKRLSIFVQYRNEWSFTHCLIPKVGGTQVYTVKVTFMLLERLVVLPGKVVSIRKKTSSFKLQWTTVGFYTPGHCQLSQLYLSKLCLWSEIYNMYCSTPIKLDVRVTP